MKKFILLMCILNEIVLSENKMIVLNNEIENKVLVTESEKPENNYNLYTISDLEWQVFFTAFYNNYKIGKSNSNSAIKEIEPSEPKLFRLTPTIRKRFITFNDKDIDLVIPVIPEISDITIIKNPVNINVPTLPDLPDLTIGGTTSFQVKDINITRDISITLLSENIIPKTFDQVVIPTLSLRGNGNGYNSGSTDQNLYTNFDDFPEGTMLASNATQTALAQIIGTEGSTYADPTGGVGNLTYVVTSDIGTESSGSRIIAIESHRTQDGSPAGDPNEVISFTTMGKLMLNTNNAKALEIEQGYNGRGDVSYVNQGSIISDPSSYDIIGIDFIGNGSLLHAENWGSITLNGDTSVGIEVLNATTTIGITNRANAEINLYGNGSYGIYLNNGNFLNTVVQIATNIDSSINFTNIFTQDGKINLYGTDSYGVVVGGSAKFPDNTVLNNGEITVNGDNSTAIYQNISAKPFLNSGSVVVNGANSNGVRVDNGTNTNSSTGIITLNGNVTNSVGMAATNLNGTSIIINDGEITVDSINNGNIGMYGVNGGLTNNTIENIGEIILNLSNTSEQNIGVVNINSKFQNDGSIKLNSLGINTGNIYNNIAVYSETGTVNLGVNSNVNLRTNGNDIGIYAKNNNTLNISGNISVESLDVAGDYDYGIYLDSSTSNTLNLTNTTFTIKGNSAGIYSGWDGINFSSGNIINLFGTEGIGVLYEVTSNSPTSGTGSIVNNSGIINLDQGTGIYILDNGNTGLKKLENNNEINITNDGIGIVLSSKAYSNTDNLEIINNGIIDNTGNSILDNNIGIYSTNENLKVSGTGSIKVSGTGGNVGLYVSQGDIEFNSTIELGENGIGIYLNGSSDDPVETNLKVGTTGSELTQLAGTRGVGIVSIGEKSNITMGIGGLTLLNSSTTNEGSLGVYIKNSNIDNSAGGIIKVGDNGAAAYLNAVDISRNIKLGKLESGKNSIGLYTENSSFIDSIESVTTGENSSGIYIKSGVFDNALVDESKFYLGTGSNGYFLENGNLQSSLGSKDIILGDNLTGISMTGDSNLDGSIRSIKIGDRVLLSAQPIVLGVVNLDSDKSLFTGLYGGDGAVGLYYGAITNTSKVTYNGSGLGNPDIEVGEIGGVNSAVGAYAKNLSNANVLDLNNVYLRVNGDGSVAVGTNGATVNINGGKIEITGSGTLFVIQNNGNINISPTTEIVTPDSNIEILTVANSTFSTNSGTNLIVPNSSVGIFARSSIITNEGKITSKIFSGTKAVQSTGIYIENLGYAVNKGTIDLGNEGIGLFGHYSIVTNDSIGTINIGDSGAGEYITLGSKTENAGKITVGNKSIGIYADDVAGITALPGIGKENKIKNTGIIESIGERAVGIYSIGYDLNNRSTIENTGNINLSGSNSSGIFGGRTDITNTGNISTASGFTGALGFTNYSLGIYGRDSIINLNGGSIKLGDYSIGVGLLSDKENSEIRINSGTIELGVNSVYNYIKRVALSNSTITLNDTSGGVYDLNKLNQVGIYTSEGNVYSNKTIYVREGTESIGVYGKNFMLSDMEINGLTLNVENGQTGILLKTDIGSQKRISLNNKVNLSGNNAVGIIQEEGRVLNSGEIIATGIKAIGILAIDSNSNNIAELENTGIINVNGSSSVGIYGTTDGTGQLQVNNAGLIKVSSTGGSTNNVGIYGEKNSVINNTGDLVIGIDSVGIYGNQIQVNQTGGTINIEGNGIGFYGKGGQVQVNNSLINANGENSAGFYGTDGAQIIGSGTINVGNNISLGGSFGYVGRNGSTLINNAILNINTSSVGMYGYNSTIINMSRIANSGTTNNMINSRIGMYGDNNSNVINLGNIETGDVSLGIYAEESTVDNQGTIKVGNTYVNPNNSVINDFAAGMYGYNNLNMINSGTIETGIKGMGIYSYEPMGKIENNGVITSNGEETVGVFIEVGQGEEFINRGSIILTGNNSIGIAGMKDVKITNDSTGVINLSGENSVGIYADENVEIENKGLINITGKNGIGILMKNGSTLINSGTINVDLSNGGQVLVTDPSVLAPIGYLNPGPKYDLPSITNAGIILVNEKFIVPEDAVVQIKVDPSTIRPASPLPTEYAPEDINGKFLVSDAVKFIAPEFILRNIEVTPDFSQGTNISVYKLEEVFNPTTSNGGLNSGISDILSKGIFWEAIPNINSKGNLDIWMKRIMYSQVAEGTWWENFAKNLDDKYDNAQGEALLFYDRLDMVEDAGSLNKIIGNITGNVYSNINQRENDVVKTFEDSLNLLQNSKNNTDESVKINIIAGKGTTEEKTQGVIGYDYTTTGVLALKEIEKNDKHKIGYSLGYLHTGFEFDDNNESEEWVDTIQLGGHNKYEVSNWIFRNDLTGRISFHDIDRNVDWGKSGRTEMNGTYETYSLTSDNIIGREIALGNDKWITPYGAFRLMYIIRPDFEEEGKDRLEVEGNDAWSIKPRVGVELKTEVPLGKKEIWKLRGTLDLAYEYELGDLNVMERAKLGMLETDYHDLAKPEEEGGSFRTRATLGVEIQDKYGVFLNGEYIAGEHNENDYRAGVILKAVF